jgi:CheY-like chemotaxis protein/HPt (histidine-containing phosphotransfer) domain-containing protein
MDGQIGVESEPGNGSRFWFTLAFEKQKESKALSPPLPVDIRGMRMLVVDDNRTNRMILVKMLESFGCHAEAVVSGEEALATLKKSASEKKLFDLVLLDMQMPGMDGEQTLKAIKNDPQIKDMVVIVLTSVGVRGDAARLKVLGCAGYLMKPIKQSQLYDAIITVLGLQKDKRKEKTPSLVTRHTIAEQKRRGIRILLAEDNPMNQKLAVTLLKRAGYSVDAVENGAKAIEALKSTAYNLILMDVQMPEMNGFEATKVIRQMQDKKKCIPIIAMTAHAMKGDRERCLQAGMDDYISKPIEPQKLLNAVEMWTKSHRLRQMPRTEELKKEDHLEDIPIDLKTALDRFGGDEKFFKEMLEEFLDHAPEQLQIMDEAVKKGNAKIAEREAHSIKGAAGNLSAKRIAEISLKLELLGREGDLAGVEVGIEELRTELNNLEEYVNRSLFQEIELKS